MAHIMRYKFPDGLCEVVIATIMKEVRVVDRTWGWLRNIRCILVSSGVRTDIP